MSNAIKSLLLVTALSIGAGMLFGALLGGISSGAIDGPARGADVVQYSEHPVEFCFLAGGYLGLALLLATYAYILAKRRPAV